VLERRLAEWQQTVVPASLLEGSAEAEDLERLRNLGYVQ
jgi:hypothetical protein